MIEDLAVSQRTTRDSTDGRWATARWRAVCLIALVWFVGLGVSAFATGVLPGDLSVRADLLLDDDAALYRLARTVNVAGTWRALLPAFALLFVLSPAMRQRWWLWCAVLPVGGLFEKVMKFLVDRPRPSGFSLGYPSGHTTSAAAFAVIVIYLSTRERWSRRTRVIVQVVAVVAVVLVGWARVVLHAHWPTDVLGGFLLGTACAAGAAWWDSAHRARR
jgi:undecaprenyl-diphosphatase